MTKRVFDNKGDFEATNAAEQWCRENGISVGRMQNTAPRGLLRGHYDIQKWRNLNAREIAQLDGTMTGDPRHGPITIELKECKQ